MSGQSNDHARHLLKRMLLAYPHDLSAHRWGSESERWKELAFSLISRTTSVPERHVRDIVHQLDALELLSISSLAATLKSSPSVGSADPTAVRIIEVLEDNGLSPEQSRSAVVTLTEAAAAISEGFAGKIQNYLRSYAQQMIDDVPHYFHFSALGPDEVRHAFTFWIQNVLQMPISLRHPKSQAWCAAQGLTLEQMHAAADEMDLNLGLVDDLLFHFSSLPTSSPSPVAKKTRKSALGPKRKRLRGK